MKCQNCNHEVGQVSGMYREEETDTEIILIPLGFWCNGCEEKYYKDMKVKFNSSSPEPKKKRVWGTSSRRG